MSTVHTPAAFGYLWKSLLAWGLLTVVLGVVVLVWPGMSILVASGLFGAYLLVSGLAQVMFAFGLDVSAGSRVLLFISGALSVVLAVLAFRHFGQGYAVLLLAIWIGVSFVFQGTAQTALAISYPELPGRGWYIFLGIISVAAGIVMLAWPFDSIVVLALVTGVWLLVIGISEIIWSFQARKDVKSVEHGIESLTRATA